MKRFWIIALMLVPSLAQEEMPGPGHGFATPPGVKRQSPPRAWLGVDLIKADDSIRVHLPSLPPGIGFVVRAMHKESPAVEAGFKEYDVVWKLDEQLLVNEAQLATLLRLHKPGDEVTLSTFRHGNHMELKLTLGKSPKGSRRFPGDLVDSAILSNQCGGPMRVVNIADKEASYQGDDGGAKIWRKGEIYYVKITDGDENPVYEGELPADGSLGEVPDKWRRRVHALRRGLNHALSGRTISGRQPRPRVVPPSESGR